MGVGSRREQQISVNKELERRGARQDEGSTQHLIGGGPSRLVKTRGPPYGWGGGAHVEPISHGSRLGVAAWPGPSKFEMMGSGSARTNK